jgi:GntR family transcriptional regulator
VTTPLFRNVGLSLHHQISVILRSAIQSGRYGPGDYLPGELALMETYEVSRATVRRAILTLEREGLIDRRPGKGTRVVVGKAIPLSDSIGDHLHLIERSARKTSITVLAVDHQPATPAVSRALDVAPSTEIVAITRVRRKGDLPLRYMITYLPTALGDQLQRSTLRRVTVVGALKDLGHPVRRAEDEIGATLADPGVAAALEISAGEPLIEIYRRMLDADGAPLAYQWTVVPSGMFRLRVVIEDEGAFAVPSTVDLGVLVPGRTVRHHSAPSKGKAE